MIDVSHGWNWPLFWVITLSFQAGWWLSWLLNRSRRASDLRTKD